MMGDWWWCGEAWSHTNSLCSFPAITLPAWNVCSDLQLFLTYSGQSENMNKCNKTTRPWRLTWNLRIRPRKRKATSSSKPFFFYRNNFFQLAGLPLALGGDISARLSKSKMIEMATEQPWNSNSNMVIWAMTPWLLHDSMQNRGSRQLPINSTGIFVSGLMICRPHSGSQSSYFLTELPGTDFCFKKRYRTSPWRVKRWVFVKAQPGAAVPNKKTPRRAMGNVSGYAAQNAKLRLVELRFSRPHFPGRCWVAIRWQHKLRDQLT